jgi:hypothetical protein
MNDYIRSEQVARQEAASDDFSPLNKRDRLRAQQALGVLIELLPHVTDADWHTHDDLWTRLIGRCPACGLAALELENDGTAYCDACDWHEA